MNVRVTEIGERFTLQYLYKPNWLTRILGCKEAWSYFEYASLMDQTPRYLVTYSSFEEAERSAERCEMMV